MQYYIFEYTIGSDSCSGHDRCESGYIHVNHSNEELLAAMNTFKEKTGCNWEKWFRNYQDNSLSKDETIKVLEYLGVSKANDFDIEDDCLYVYNASGFIALMMAICRVALPDLDWCYHTPKVDGEAFFSDMGYGLFME